MPQSLVAIGENAEWGADSELWAQQEARQRADGVYNSILQDKDRAYAEAKVRVCLCEQHEQDYRTLTPIALWWLTSHCSVLFFHNGV